MYHQGMAVDIPPKFRNHFRTGRWWVLPCVLIVTLVTNIFLLPLWTDCDVTGFIRTLFNNEARLDIMYTGAVTGCEPFHVTSTPRSNNSNWYNGVHYTTDLKTGWKWGEYSVTLKMRQNGRLRILLRGMDQSNDYGEKYCILADYRNLRVNNRVVFSAEKKVSFTKSFAYDIPVRVGENISITFDVRRHHFHVDEFDLIGTRNFWYIVSLSIFMFTISYMLLERLNVMRGQGKAEDTVFLFIFFLVLAVPMIYMSDAQVSRRERRTTEKCPALADILKENADFGKKYDNWFCDHLGGREYLFKVHDGIMKQTQEIIQTPQAWYFREDGWMFRTPFTWVPSAKLIHPIVTSLMDFKLFCDTNHIKFYVLIVPRKANIYWEHLSGYGSDREKGMSENRFHEQVKRETARKHIAYIYPWKELREASKTDYTYFKLTHHWTDWGAYVGYKALMQEIRRDFPNVPVVSLSDYNQSQSILIRDDWDRSFYSGFLFTLFGFESDSQCPTTLYNYYNHKNAGRLALKIGRYTKDFRYGGGGVHRMMLIGTSQCENLLNYLPYSAANTKFIRINKAFPGTEQYKIMKNFKKEILSYKPDILIFSIWGNLTQLPYLQYISTK